MIADLTYNDDKNNKLLSGVYSIVEEKKGCMAIRAIYFDLDNTLVDRAASIEKLAHQFLVYYGSRIVNPGIEDISLLLKQVDNGGYLAPDAQFSKIYEVVGVELTSKLMWSEKSYPKELAEFWRKTLPGCSIEMHGASELIKWLHQHCYFIGVISNGAHDSRKRTLAATTLHPYISQLVSSEISGKKKTNRDIFIDTTRSQGFAPSECV